ncbi:acyL-CoA dehydrogenase domain-containing protein [Cupriavidus basilensis OR16]|uniref:Acyl-coenzyme A dehydrogenase n=2 Tax=Cupriavidus basilensis TaxID=68895 RepID=H1RZR4_9BURK|nr:acyL-CoA dehydrogenase domain-containing protein [Cupriavidus basilensis OR16]
MPTFTNALPKIGETERAALESGTVGFEGCFFEGKADFARLAAIPAEQLTEEEQEFLQRRVPELCGMLDDFAIDEAHDLPVEVWHYLREHRFFGMIIPRAYGGLEFSHAAHAAVVTRIASVNIAAAVTVMVPNSLGPSELLVRYGTEAQKNHYLPRLARCADLPCFALTSAYAGSDAAAIPDIGVLTQREWNGAMTEGFALTFSKRYITLAPVATLVGLAFNAIDPTRPAGTQQLGITCALIPVPHPGLHIGARHRPMNSAFMNGPVQGEDVFIPLDWVIGGSHNIGRGWRMLMECLAAGRGISLPAIGAALQQTSLYVANGYARLRNQFGLPIQRFPSIAAPLAEMAIDLYATDSARRLTTSTLDQGEQPSVASAILKYHLTEAGRRAINHGMDILGGKAICAGPSNLLSTAYRHAPIAITVEGANILTRALIIFGQGAVRCHPYVLKEIQAVEQRNVIALGDAVLGHGGHLLHCFWGSLAHASRVGNVPPGFAHEARKIARLAAKFAFTTDICMGVLGGKLKRLELLSSRLGDALSHLYMACACLWRYAGQPEAELAPIVRGAIRHQIWLASEALHGLYDNVSNPVLRIAGKIALQGLSPIHRLRDSEKIAIADALGDTRVIRRLCPDIETPRAGGLRDLYDLLALAQELGETESQRLAGAIRELKTLEDIAATSSAQNALAFLRALYKVIQVDSFPADGAARPPHASESLRQ